MSSSMAGPGDAGIPNRAVSAAHAHLGYRREIDGLRAVAVLAVVLFHAGVPGFGGGYVGVDVFFVISGYLITRIILNDLANGSFSLGSFYARRARRILPALFLVLAACLPVAWLTLQPTDLADFGQSLLATVLFGSNLLFAFRDSYFDVGAELNPLLHTWSLSVEEQFYLVFPAALWWLSRAPRARWRGAVVAALALLSLAVANHQALQQSSAAFYLPHTRVWELALGSLAAMLVEPHLASPRWNRWRAPLALLGLILIVASVGWYDDRTPFPGLYALAPTLGAALIILFASPRDPVGRLLGTRGAVAVGLISYSLYLWHQPVFAFFRHVEVEPAGAPVWGGLILLCVGLAYLSWRFVETPARQGGRGLPTRHILGAAALVSLLFAAIGWTLHAKAGFPSRIQHIIERVPAYQPDNRQLQIESWTPLRTLHKVPRYQVTDNPSDRVNRFSGDATSIKVLVVGNSHAKDTFNALFLNRDRFTGYEFARYGLQLACLDASSNLFDAPSYQAANVILVSTRWANRPCPGSAVSRHDLQGLDPLHERTRADGKLLVLTTSAPEFRQFHNKTVADVMIMEHALRGPQLADAQDIQALAQSINQQYHEARSNDPQLLDVNRRLQQWAQTRQLPVLDKATLMCDESARSCMGVSDGLGKTLFDHSHYTLEGARLLGQRAHELRWLDPVEQALRNRAP